MVNDRSWLWLDFYFIAIDLCPCQPHLLPLLLLWCEVVLKRVFARNWKTDVICINRFFAGAFMSIDKPKLQTPVNERKHWALWTSTIWALSSLLHEFGPANTFSTVHVYHKHGMPFKDLRMVQTYLAPNWIVEWQDRMMCYERLHILQNYKSFGSNGPWVYPTYFHQAAISILQSLVPKSLDDPPKKWSLPC